MNPDIIGEAWQAMSVLSDAQESLGDESFLHLDQEARMARANERIDHAKRHMVRLFELARAEDQDSFFKGTLVLQCTLQEGEQEHQVITGDEDEGRHDHA